MLSYGVRMTIWERLTDGITHVPLEWEWIALAWSCNARTPAA